MTKQIYIINGSPRKNWNTSKMCENFAKGIIDVGGNVEIINLYDIDFKGCRACSACKLKNGKKSRLALLLKHQYINEDRMATLVEEFSNFNKSVISNKDHKFDEIEQAKKGINNAMIESMGNVFGQSVNLQFSENTFSSILQNIKMVFFPHIGEVDEEKFRDVAINSLGYNNLLYIATVFAELEIINKQNSLFTVLLIEEPEAHLHPQIQS